MSEDTGEAVAERVSYDATVLFAATKGQAHRAVTSLVKKRKRFAVSPVDGGWEISVEEENEVGGMAGRWMQ